MSILQRIKSVRFVLTFWYSLVLVAAIALIGYGVFMYLKELEEAELERNLTEEVDWIASLMDLEKGRFTGKVSVDRLSEDIERRIIDHFVVNPRNYIVFLTTGSGDILFQSRGTAGQILPGADVPADQTVLRSLPLREGGSVRVAARRADPFTIQVAYTEQITRSVLQNLLSIFVVLTPVALFLSVAGGWFLSGLVLRPIRQISQLANKITAHDLNQQIPPRTVDDELGELISTINGMIRRLHASFEQMREFSMSVAHELKTPLTILKGESELALTKPINSADAERLATTYLEETVRMSKIVEDLLDLAKADAGQMVLENARVQMDGLLRELYEDAQILGTAKHLHVDLVKNDPAAVQGDSLRLRQLFRAILSNAVQYNELNGAIRISSSVSGADLCVEVEDTGIGIPPEDLQKIFQRFYRVDAARSRARGGSGLGLAIAKWIVEAHHGSLAVRSTPGKGSCFTVHLPLFS
jgi:heavy metal sensor kinase